MIRICCIENIQRYIYIYIVIYPNAVYVVTRMTTIRKLPLIFENTEIRFFTSYLLADCYRKAISFSSISGVPNFPIWIILRVLAQSVNTYLLDVNTKLALITALQNVSRVREAVDSRSAITQHSL